MVIRDRSALSVRAKETTRLAGTCRSATALSDSLPSPVVRLPHLRVREGLPIYRLGRVPTWDGQRVTRLLHRVGITLRLHRPVRMPSGRRNGGPPDLARLLEGMHVGRHLTTAQPQARDGHPARTDHDRLRRYGIRATRSGGILQRPLADACRPCGDGEPNRLRRSTHPGRSRPALSSGEGCSHNNRQDRDHERL